MAKDDYLHIHKNWLFVLFVVFFISLVVTFDVSAGQSELIPRFVAFVGGGDYVQISELPECTASAVYPCIEQGGSGPIIVPSD